MSIKVQSYVWEHSKAKGSALLLLLAIADFSHDDGTGAWPSTDTLAHKCRQSVRNVVYLLRQLEEMGELLTAEREGPHGCNAYIIPMTYAKFADAKISPLQTSAEGDAKQHDEVCKPARQIAPEPLRTIIEPSENRQDVSSGNEPAPTNSPAPELAPKEQARAAVLSAMHRESLNGDSEAFEKLWEFCNQPTLYQAMAEQWRAVNPKKAATMREVRTMMEFRVHNQKRAAARSGP